MNLSGWENGEDFGGIWGGKIIRINFIKKNLFSKIHKMNGIDTKVKKNYHNVKKTKCICI